MIVRIVKMKFKEECRNEFLELFSKYHAQIASFENCLGVELLNDMKDKNIFFTYSKWKSEADLNKYRESALFKTVWAKAKAMFIEKAEAWSVLNVK